MRSDRLVMLRADRRVENASLGEAYTHDFYAVLLRRLVEVGELREATLVLRSTVDTDIPLGGGVTLRLVRSFRRLPVDMVDGAILWVRGDKAAYRPAIRRAGWALRIFYAANEQLVPGRTGGYDGWLVDDPQRLDTVAQAAGRVPVAELRKTADPLLFHPLSAAEKHFDVMCVGDMTNPKKRMAAIPPLMHALPGLRWLIVGRPDAGLIAQLEAAPGEVEHHHRVNRVQLNTYYNRSRLVVLPSQLDAAPRVIFEAMAAGTPVIVNAKMASGPGCVREGAGLAVLPDRFAEAVSAVLSNDVALDPQAVFERHYHPHVAADVLAKSLRKITAERRPPSPLRVSLANTPLIRRLRRTP